MDKQILFITILSVWVLNLGFTNAQGSPGLPGGVQQMPPIPPQMQQHMNQTPFPPMFMQGQQPSGLPGLPGGGPFVVPQGGGGFGGGNGGGGGGGGGGRR